MTFSEKLRDIQGRAPYSTEPGRILAELAGAIAAEAEAAEADAAPAPTPEPAPAA